MPAPLAIPDLIERIVVGPIDDKTLANYLDALDRLMLIEPLPA